MFIIRVYTLLLCKTDRILHCSLIASWKSGLYIGTHLILFSTMVVDNTAGFCPASICVMSVLKYTKGFRTTTHIMSDTDLELSVILQRWV